MQVVSLTSKHIITPLGPMIAVSDAKSLIMVEFLAVPAEALAKAWDHPKLERKLECLEKKTGRMILMGQTNPLISFEHELKAYFAGTLQNFKTPLSFLGSPFQNNVWQQLRKIPFGTTCSYEDLAKMIGNPSATRAVARANAANLLPIIIPCHRVINKSGNLGGYSGGLERKKWLINHEKLQKHALKKL